MDLDLAGDLRQKRRRAEGWVNGYTATAIAAVVVVSPVPGAATPILCGIEATMCWNIGKQYRGDGWTMADAKAVAGLIGLAAFAGQIIALEAAILLGPFAPIGKAAIAGSIVKGMGKLIIRHFEVLAEGAQ
jgi:uncharacterized protein (DUF697 family)